MDAHNAGIFPLDGRYRSLITVSRWIIRNVYLTIVTNEELAKVVSSLGGVPYIITDPIPKIHCDSEAKDSAPYQKDYILLVCAWADDEPYSEVIKAMERLNHPDLELRITGSPPVEISKAMLAENIILEGYVSREKYESLVCNAKLIIDLTTRESCLVCGAYEAAAAGKPCILSDDTMARSVFNGGYLFTKNTEEEIANSVKNALNSLSVLEEQMRQFKIEYDSKISIRIKEFEKTIHI
ncbi:MAG: glycosyltransferase [Marinobacter sp.]|nr:glycosyltransferase [Marinobacter sp.]